MRQRKAAIHVEGLVLAEKDKESESDFPGGDGCEVVLALPNHVIENHPLVRELRAKLQMKEAMLVQKEREIDRLQVAVTFGLKKLPG